MTAARKLRLFFAVELPLEVRRVLGALRLAESAEYRWVDPALLHITLAFVGQQPDDRLEALEQVGRAAASASQPGLLKLGPAGSFGSRREPRVLWIGIDDDGGALLALQTRLASGLRKAGFDLEDRPFSPHITLARRRETIHSPGPPAWPPRLPDDPETFTLDHLTLVESRLSPRGPTYLPLLEFPLRAAV